MQVVALHSTMETCINDFDLNEYYDKLRNKILEICELANVDVEVSHEILDTQATLNLKRKSKKSKLIKAYMPRIWQEILGNYRDFEVINKFVIDYDHFVCGPHIMSKSRKIIAFISNNRTDGMFEKENVGKIQFYIANCVFDLKKLYPDYRFIYANMRCCKSCKNEHYDHKMVKSWDNEQIENWVGMAFVKEILGYDAYDIIEFVKANIERHL